MASEAEAEKTNSSPELEEILREFPRRVQETRQKHRVSDVRQLLIDVCAVQAFNATDLTELLDRERSHLVRSHLKSLVEEGVLELTHPENPRHPKQAYQVVGDRDE